MTIEEFVKEQDKHWQEVMELAQKYNFIIQAYGGTATLCTHKVFIQELGEEEYIKHMKNLYNIELERNATPNKN